MNLGGATKSNSPHPAFVVTPFHYQDNLMVGRLYRFLSCESDCVIVCRYIRPGIYVGQTRRHASCTSHSTSKALRPRGAGRAVRQTWHQESQTLPGTRGQSRVRGRPPHREDDAPSGPRQPVGASTGNISGDHVVLQPMTCNLRETHTGQTGAALPTRLVALGRAQRLSSFAQHQEGSASVQFFGAKLMALAG